MCCEKHFYDENAQRPPKFNERPRKLTKKEGGRGKKSEKFLGSGAGGSGAGDLHFLDGQKETNFFWRGIFIDMGNDMVDGLRATNFLGVGEGESSQSWVETFWMVKG